MFWPPHTQVIFRNAPSSPQMRKSTRELFLEVTSAINLQTCKEVMDALIVVGLNYRLTNNENDRVSVVLFNG